MRYGINPTNPLEWAGILAGAAPLPILDAIVGPLQGQTLMTAARCGVLARLATHPSTASELSAHCQVNSECLVLVLRVLRSMRYVSLRGQVWSLSRVGRRYFGPEAKQPYGAYLEYAPPQWEMISKLHEVLKTGVGVDFHNHQSDEDWALYQRAMVENANAFAWFVADEMPVPASAKLCLDIAGAHGMVGAALCEKHMGMRSIVLDRREALGTAMQIAKERGLTQWVSHQEANMLAPDFCDDFRKEHTNADVALLCNIVHHFDAATNRNVLAKVREALRPGGYVGIFDMDTAEDNAKADAASDAFALYFRTTSTSTCFRARDYEAWLRDAGYVDVRTARSIRLPSRLLVSGRKPAA